MQCKRFDSYSRVSASAKRYCALCANLVCQKNMKKLRNCGRDVVCIGKKLNSILFAQNAQNKPPLKTVHFEDTRFEHFAQSAQNLAKRTEKLCRYRAKDAFSVTKRKGLESKN